MTEPVRITSIAHTLPIEGAIAPEPVRLLGNHDSLSVAGEAPLRCYTITKPKIPSEYRLFSNLNKLDQSGTKFLQLHLKSLDETEKKMKKLHVESLDKLQQAAQRAQESEVWSTLQKMASCILSAISTVLGISLVQTGGGLLIGGAMIASGVLAISNLVMLETNSWDWVAEKLAQGNDERKERLKTLLPALVGVTSGAVGLMGSAGAVFWAPLNFSQQVFVIASSVANVAEGVTALGKGISDLRLSREQGALTHLRQDMTLNEFALDRNIGNVEKFFKQRSFASSQANKIIQMSINTNSKMTLRG